MPENSLVKAFKALETQGNYLPAEALRWQMRSFIIRLLRLKGLCQANEPIEGSRHNKS